MTNRKMISFIGLATILVFCSAVIYYKVNKYQYPPCFMYNNEKYVMLQRPCTVNLDGTISESRSDVDTCFTYIGSDKFDIDKSTNDFKMLNEFIDNEYNVNIDGAKISNESIYEITNIKNSYNDVVENFEAYGLSVGDTIYRVENSSGYDDERLVVKQNSDDYPYMYLYKVHDDRFVFEYW